MKKLYNEFKPYQTWLISSLLFLVVANLKITKGRELVFNAHLKFGKYDEAINGVIQNVIIDYAPIGIILISFLAVFICNKKELKKLKKIANHLHWIPVVFILFYILIF